VLNLNKKTGSTQYQGYHHAKYSTAVDRTLETMNGNLIGAYHAGAFGSSVQGLLVQRSVG
jgi:hypothetical protein